MNKANWRSRYSYDAQQVGSSASKTARPLNASGLGPGHGARPLLVVRGYKCSANVDKKQRSLSHSLRPRRCEVDGLVRWTHVPSARSFVILVGRDCIYVDLVTRSALAEHAATQVRKTIKPRLSYLDRVVRLSSAPGKFRCMVRVVSSIGSFGVRVQLSTIKPCQDHRERWRSAQTGGRSCAASNSRFPVGQRYVAIAIRPTFTAQLIPLLLFSIVCPIQIA